MKVLCDGSSVHSLTLCLQQLFVSRPSLPSMTRQRSLERMAMSVRDTWDYNTRNKIIRIDGAADLD